MNAFELFRVVAAVATSTEAPVAELSALQSAAADPIHGEALFQKALASTFPAAAATLHDGDAGRFLLVWKTAATSGAPEEWQVEGLKPFVEALERSWVDAPAASVDGEGVPFWHGAVATIYESTPAEVLAELGGLEPLAAEHAFYDISHERGEEVVLWFNTLPKDRQDTYFWGLKRGNRLLKRMVSEINPEGVDPAELPPGPRIEMVKTYLAHPFEHILQPFYSETFSQLLKMKCLTPEELFAEGDDLIAAHVRQGMAYLDLARLYGQHGRTEDALLYIDKGLTLHVMNGNRLGFYLLEKTVILREAGRLDEARATFAEVPFDQLDQYNRGFHARVEASLRDESPDAADP